MLLAVVLLWNSIVMSFLSVEFKKYPWNTPFVSVGVWRFLYAMVRLI